MKALAVAAVLLTACSPVADPAPVVEVVARGSEGATTRPQPVVTRTPTPPRPVHSHASRSRPRPNLGSVDGLLWRIALCESGGNPRAVSASGKYRGLLQFDRATWASVGGTGDPAAASISEQLRRGQILYSRRGISPWPYCGRKASR